MSAHAQEGNATHLLGCLSAGFECPSKAAYFCGTIASDTTLLVVPGGSGYQARLSTAVSSRDMQSFGITFKGAQARQCVCVYICMYIYMYVYVYVCMGVYIYIYIYIYMYMCVYVYIYVSLKKFALFVWGSISKVIILLLSAICCLPNTATALSHHQQLCVYSTTVLICNTSTFGLWFR